MAPARSIAFRRMLFVLLLVLAVAGAVVFGRRMAAPPAPTDDDPPLARVKYQPRRPLDTSGFLTINQAIPAWPRDASLGAVADAWRGIGTKLVTRLDGDLANDGWMMPPERRVGGLVRKAAYLNFENEAVRAYALLETVRAEVAADPRMAEGFLYSVIYFQGVTALRRGETDNCVMCRGESSCILPLAPAAVHAHPVGSRLAIQHFTEYLAEFPDDGEVRWLLNVAHMTLGAYPDKVDPRYRVALDKYVSAEHGIGKFRDVGHLVGLNRFNLAGGAILDDFDNDGRLDVVFTSMDAATPMGFYRNAGNGTFEDRSGAAGVLDQLGGLNGVQADYNNDGFLDVFVCRGAWLAHPVRPSLLRNNGNGTFTDVTISAGLDAPMNSIAAQWADYDNDGHLDLFVCGERQPSRLYRNRGDSTFEEVSARAGVPGPGGTWKGVAWLDFDRDRFPDLFLTDYSGAARLYHNNGNGMFTEVTKAAGIDGPTRGFACWAWDYDNDGWPDLFATCYEYEVGDIVAGMTTGRPAGEPLGRLYQNTGGAGFRDVTASTGLALQFAAMGCNFGDFDNDGYLDFYLGTGDPQLSTLVPNRMFRNLRGRRFAEITGSSGTGHLQKGHGVACGDWDRNGTTDVLIQMGGAIPGDQYHNVLFQNPGTVNRSVTVKLIGKQTNRAAIGARIKAVTAGPDPRTVYRWVSSGSSFGANPLEQHLGLGDADRIAELEVYWPTSGTTQVFRDIPAGRYLEITEFATDVRTRDFTPIPLPK